MYVEDALIPNPLTISPDATVPDLLRNFVGQSQGTSAVLEDDGTLVGMVGIHDVLRAIVPLYIDLDRKLMEVMHSNYLVERLERLKETDTRVRELMTGKVDFLEPRDTLIKAAAIIVDRRRKVIPVLDDGKFVGIVSRRSIVEAVCTSLL